MPVTSRALLLVAIAIAAWPSRAWSEDLDAPDPAPDEKEAEWNEYQGRYFSIRAGGGLLLDYATYSQNDDSEQQMAIDPTGGIRDLRFLVSGHFLWSRLGYTSGYMYDAKADEWQFRQTGLKLQIPELGGYLFVGRTKEGFSTNKLMVGYYGVFNERSAANDAFLPILADGARWAASAFGGRLVYNLGAFGDKFSEEQTFNKNDWQVVGRAVWVPFAQDDSTTLLHLAFEARYAGANDGFLQYRSKPESFFAQTNAVDTGEFEASRATTLGAEAYYRPGPLLLGLEYYVNAVSSTPASDPVFHGGDISASYLLTGEMHPYNANGGFFTDVKPRRPFAKGGPGAWEVALRASYVDLDSGPVLGGKFWRLTPALNWYLSDVLRFEAVYGYGVLDRMGMSGGTQFFQTRMQLAL
jgi:phosphate-selective porin OprO/OprP